MAHDKLRQRIACEAARRMYEQHESFHRAKLKAAQQIITGWIHPRYLPTHREIRAELEQLARLHEVSDARLLQPEAEVDRFRHYESLLLPLEHVHQASKYHPEGDALYHSLQVFEQARDRLPYDEEFLLAALLHDVGKAIDPQEHVAAGLDALAGYVTERTAWLIESHPVAQLYARNEMGSRAKRRLEAAEHFEELMLLAECDRAGRQTGVQVPEVHEALDYVRGLEAENERESAD